MNFEKSCQRDFFTIEKKLRVIELYPEIVKHRWLTALYEQNERGSMLQVF